MLNPKVLKQLANICVHEDFLAIEKHKEAIGYTSESRVNNSTSKSKWDSRYNRIATLAEANNLKPIIINRKIWEAIGIYDEITQIFYVVLRDTNLKNIRRNTKKSHYSIIFNYINKAFQPSDNGQLVLHLNTHDYDEKLEENCTQMLESLNISPKKFIIFSFEDNWNKFFRAYMFNHHQDIIFFKDYTHLITTNYEEELQSTNFKPPIKPIGENKRKLKKASQRILGLKAVLDK